MRYYFMIYDITEIKLIEVYGTFQLINCVSACVIKSFPNLHKCHRYNLIT